MYLMPCFQIQVEETADDPKSGIVHMVKQDQTGSNRQCVGGNGVIPSIPIMGKTTPAAVIPAVVADPLPPPSPVALIRNGTSSPGIPDSTIIDASPVNRGADLMTAEKAPPHAGD